MTQWARHAERSEASVNYRMKPASEIQTKTLY